LEEAKNVRHIKAESIELSADLKEAMNEVVALAILDALKKSLDALYISGRITINKKLIDKVVLNKGVQNEQTKTGEVD
jgi:transcription elongation factor GreA-like protein